MGWRSRWLESGRWSVLLCLFAIPINKPATSIGIFLALLFSLLAADVRVRFGQAVRQPVVLGCVAWFGVLALNCLHGSGGVTQLGDLAVYKALLYPLVAATVLTTPQWRNRGLLAFGAAVTLVLILSWSQLFGLMPAPEKTKLFEVFRYTVFKDYSQQGVQFLMLTVLAAAFASAERTDEGYGADSLSARPRLRLGLWCLAAAAFLNVMFLLQSRTAYLTILPLAVFWSWKLYVASGKSRRLLVLGIILAAVLAGSLAFAPRVQERMDAAEVDVSKYLNQHAATSLGIRLELWRRTLPMIASAPWFGLGLGEWPREYQRQTRDLPNFEAYRMGHPHQEALVLLAETGLVGFGVFIYLLLLLARHMRGMPQPQRDFFLSLLIMYVSVGLANCIMLDFVHRHGFLMLLACVPVALAPRARAIEPSPSAAREPDLLA